jgi:hypothetical protein
MADDKDTQAAPAAAFDMDALAARLQQSASQGVQQAIEGVARRNQDQQNRERANAATQADPVASTIMPILAPALRELAIKGDSGRDAAVFYATTPQAAKYSGGIEARFNELLARGIPVDRASLWNLIKGENQETFVAEAIKNRDAEVKAAQDAATVRGSRGGAPQGQIREASGMTQDELLKALDNVAF